MKNGSGQNLCEEKEQQHAIYNKKSKFNKMNPKNYCEDSIDDKEKLSSSNIPSSNDNLDKIEEEMIIEEFGFENSNNNNSGMIQQEGKQLLQDVEQDQQQVPHLYIRNQNYATKVGIKYQAVIPELVSYDQSHKHLERLVADQKVWGRDWIEKGEKTIIKCTATLKQWYGHRRNEEECIQHLLFLGFDSSQYNKFLEENQDQFYTTFNQMDTKYIKKKSKKRSLYSCK